MDAETISAVAKMRTTQAEIEHRCSFTVNEWEVLVRFAMFAEELSQTALLTKNERLSFSVVSREDGGCRFEANSMPTPDEFNALLLLMRPFVLNSEETYFPRVRNILWQRIEHPSFRAYFERQKAIFNAERCQAMRLVANDVVVNSVRTLDLWLNGYPYHKDREKRAAFEALHHPDALPSSPW
jgi:hypothetical protein